MDGWIIQRSRRTSAPIHIFFVQGEKKEQKDDKHIIWQMIYAE